MPYRPVVSGWSINSRHLSSLGSRKPSSTIRLKHTGTAMSTHPTSDQYHHFIPRFILKRYMLPIDPSKSKDGKRRKRNAPMNEQEMIHYYNMGSCELEVRPLARVYGVENLYRDVKNIKNVNDLEEQLSRLEGASATVIKTIHDSLGRRECQIKRKALESLRKFLFIMFYRKSALASSYYDENHSENAPLAEWLRHVKKKNALNSREEVWLYFLRFFLTTPHQDLISRAVTAMEKHGIAVISPSNIPESAMNDYATIDYATITSGYFLGIVEAADGKEFIMSDNSFGLWEGVMMMLGMYAHRLFVVSPCIALLLRRNECRTDALGSTFVNSDLIDIRIEPPQVEYPGGKAGLLPEELMKHRQSPKAQNDMYHFQVVKLTMIKTLQDYRKTNDAVLFTSSNLKNSYSAFMTKLTSDDRPKEAPSSVKPKNRSSDRDKSKEDDTESAISPITISLDDLRLCSDYNQAYQRYSMASMDEPVGQYIFDTTDFLAEQFRNLPLLDVLGALQGGSRARTDPFAKLVETLPETYGAFVLGKMKGLIAEVEIQRWDDATISGELYEAAIVGLLEWLVKNKGDVLKTLFPDIVLVQSLAVSKINVNGFVT